MNALKIRGWNMCPVCGSYDVYIHKQGDVFKVGCNTCGVYRQGIPAEDEESDIIEPGQYTKEEALARYEDGLNNLLNKVYGEGRREL